MKKRRKISKMPRHIYTCAIQRKPIDIAKVDSVKISGHDSAGIKFVVYASMSSFFKKFVGHQDVPKPLPGLRPYRNKRFPKIRFHFDPAIFGDKVERFAPVKIFCDLMG